MVPLKARFGLTALVAMLAIGFMACSPNPPKVLNCYWYPPWTGYSPTTTTTDPSTIPPGSEFRCVDPDAPPSSTLLGYPAPIPAGTRTVK